MAHPPHHGYGPPPHHGPPRAAYANGGPPQRQPTNPQAPPPPPPPHPAHNYSQPIQAILAQGAERNMHHAQTLGLVAMNGQQPVPGPRAIQAPSLIKLDKETELCWVAAGRAADRMNNPQRAIVCFESTLQHNPHNPDALRGLANIYRSQEDFVRGADYFMRALAVRDTDGEMWGSLGHCYLMTDDLPKAYNCYQQAIINSVDSKNEPKLWYGIGILYDRYGSLDHAEEAFASVIKMDPNFDRANEVYFRLGIIYKQQKNSRASLQCFQYILSNPPRPLTEIDIWFQIGHVYEQQQEFDAAKDAYDRVLQANPNHAKVLQQLGGLYQRKRASFYDPDRSVAILTKSLEHDAADAFSWYLLGRAYMTAGNFGKAYEAYQQAVYRDGKNPAFWCSIGVLYCNINQFHDSLDAYSRAIRINPYLAEVWFNLGALYESCNDQMNDAVDAYQRTLQLDQSNTIAQARLTEIRAHQAQGTPLTAPPQPRDISPSSASWSYAAQINGPPNGFAPDSDPHEPHPHHGRGEQGYPPHPPAGPAYPPMQHGHSPTNGTLPQYRGNGPDDSRRSSGSDVAPYAPRSRPGLPQIRSYHDGDHVHSHLAAGGPPPPHANGHGYSAELPPEHLRGRPAPKPAMGFGGPVPPMPSYGRDGRGSPSMAPRSSEEPRGGWHASAPVVPQPTRPVHVASPRSPVVDKGKGKALTPPARAKVDEDYDDEGGADLLLGLAGGAGSVPNSATSAKGPSIPSPPPPAASPAVVNGNGTGDAELGEVPARADEIATKAVLSGPTTIKLKRTRQSSESKEVGDGETPTKKPRNESPAPAPTTTSTTVATVVATDAAPAATTVEASA